jgi:hypothetical protein
LHIPALLHVVLETHSFLLLEWVCHAIIGTPCLQEQSIDITAILRHARQMAGDGVNAEAFASLLYFAVHYTQGLRMPTIGLLNEQPLHAALKRWYARPGDVLEAALDGYIVDLRRGNHIIEIQTGGFAAIRRKMRTLSRHYRVTLVYPVAYERWILKLPTTTYGQPVRRKSPRRQRMNQLFQELVSFPDLLRCPNFSIEIVCIQAEEVQRYDRRPGRRRRGWVIVERRLLGVLERHVIATPSDLWSLISWELPEPFHTLQLARLLHRPRWFAQKVAYCLCESGASTTIGKAGNALVYSRAPRDGARLHNHVEPLTECGAAQVPPCSASLASDSPDGDEFHRVIALLDQ